MFCFFFIRIEDGWRHSVFVVIIRRRGNERRGSFFMTNVTKEVARIPATSVDLTNFPNAALTIMIPSYFFKEEKNERSEGWMDLSE